MNPCNRTVLNVEHDVVVIDHRRDIDEEARARIREAAGALRTTCIDTGVPFRRLQIGPRANMLPDELVRRSGTARLVDLMIIATAGGLGGSALVVGDVVLGIVAAAMFCVAAALELT